MKLLKLMTASVATIAAASATTTIAYAQQTTSEIRGAVTDATGAPVDSASVTIRDSRTGSSRTVSVNDGQFNARNLQVGGPYTVSVSADGFRGETIEGIFISVGGATNLTFDLESVSAGGSSDEIVVVATRANTQQLAIGPNSTFGLETIEALPSISRDIRDVIRVDPRLTVSGGDDQVSCLGGNSRATSFTIDGVQVNDAFGLNASGTPARANFPLPFDAIQETAVEFAPYDVQYGNFTTCNINIVTKSGTNEFHGSAFAVFTNRGLTGSTADDITLLGDAEFRDFNWGAEVRGPIVKDKLFLAVAYEEIRDGGSIIGFGPEDGSFANPVDNFTNADLAELSAIADGFGFPTGGLASVVPETSRRISTRVDWFLSDEHRLEANYVRERELEVEPDLFNVDFQPLNSFENSGSSNERYSFRLFSDWSPNFSTEIRVSRTDNQDIQNPVGGGEAQDQFPIPRLIVAGGTAGAFGGSDGIQIAGPGFFRSANELVTQLDQVKIKGDYSFGSHLFTAGYELNSLEVFNLFIVNATGTLEFDDAAALAAGTANTITFSGTASGDPLDAAAEFTRNIHSLYFQDTWTPIDELQVSLGLRYDFYQSSDTPLATDLFEQRYGFSNDTGFNDLSVFLPRLGINYDAGSTFFGETSFRAGAGVFSGGFPTVAFSNAFTNNGFGTAFAASFFGICEDAELDVVDDAGNFTGLPSCITDFAAAGAAAGNGRVDAIDPDLQIASVIRGSLGLTHYTDFGGAAGGFFDGWTVSADIIYTANRNSFDFIDLTLSNSGTVAPDGRPILEAIDPLLDGCNATFIAPRDGFANVTPDCFTGRDQDILLTNVDGDNGRSISVSTQFAKSFDYDLFNRPASWTVNLGYAYTDATAVVSNLSSTATSLFEEISVVTPNQNPVAPSQFVNRHVVSLASTFRQEFIPDLPTSFSFFVQAREGTPFSFVFEDDTSENIFGDSDDEARTLLTVPTGPTDPLFDFSNLSPETSAEFFAFLDSSGLSEFAGGFAPRNAFRDPWFVDVDFRFQQDLPNFVDGLRTLFYVDIENVLNLIDDGRNVQRTFDRGNSREGVPVFEIDSINDAGQFVVNSRGLESQITGTDGFDRNAGASLWSVQFGLRFEF